MFQFPTAIHALHVTFYTYYKFLKHQKTRKTRKTVHAVISVCSFSKGGRLESSVKLSKAHRVVISLSVLSQVDDETVGATTLYTDVLWKTPGCVTCTAHLLSGPLQKSILAFLETYRPLKAGQSIKGSTVTYRQSQSSLTLQQTSCSIAGALLYYSIPLWPYSACSTTTLHP